MLKLLQEKDISKFTVSEMKDILKNTGGYYCLKNKNQYIDRLKIFKNILNFPWRHDQKDILDEFLKFEKKIYVIQGVFGSGKTSLLLGMLIQGILKNLFKPEEILFISFNISIRNEIKRKLKSYGISSKVKVRTFDSIIYEICKISKYKYLDLPNFEGKRKFVYELCFNKEFKDILTEQPKLIFLDECQDLEKSTLDILQYFYPKTKFVFAGDIFQSIQKEPRESILWYFMNIHKDKDNDTFKYSMHITPRVNPSILSSLKKSLKIYYPECTDTINKWKSGNTCSNADIEWKRLNSYTHIFEDLKLFLEDHKPYETMILTFSSAITVRGAMGDVARIRRFMGENGFKVNLDHKKLDPEAYFLSTANSSKGLERDYVIIFLTFPLERAFVHLSDDVIVNLITVALTRAKKKVIIYVPAYEDKFSRVLNLFENCPLPNKKRIRDGKTIKEFTFSDYIDIEHCPTELIRAGVIKYDTRIKIREHMKAFNFEKMFDSDISYKAAPIPTEEERAFVGVLMENLITSIWVNYWPQICLDDKIKNNPMYCHIIKRISNNIGKYNAFKNSNVFNDINQFHGIYLYSQCHIALSNKLFINLSEGLINNLKNYWGNLKIKIREIKPVGKKLKIQAPVLMPYISGIADAISNDDEKNVSIYEIKASQNREWVDDASLQIMIYALCCGKTWYRLHLLNPFQNSKITYYFDTKKILTLRKMLTNDVLIYNTNSFMAKMYPTTKMNEKIDVSNTLFLNILKDENRKIKQATIINMLSPIKCEILYDKFVGNKLDKSKDMDKEDRYACESELTEQELIEELKDILNSNMNKDKKIYSYTNNCNIKNVISIKKEFNIKEFDNIVKYLNYEEKEELNYSADINDSLIRNIFCLAFMFLNKNFV